MKASTGGGRGANADGLSTEVFTTEKLIYFKIRCRHRRDTAFFRQEEQRNATPTLA